jgi:predicted nucleic acid-binding protein
MLECGLALSLVLVDTSAWIEFFRGTGHPVVVAQDRLLSDDRAAITGVIRAELLQGARAEAQKAALARQLAALHQLPDPPDLWDRVADLGYFLRRSGYEVRIPDLLIAAVALGHDVPVFALDAHFPAIARVSELRLAGY